MAIHARRTRPRLLRVAKPRARASGVERKRAISADEQFRLQRLAGVFREARRAVGISLEQLAEDSGVSSGLISQIERGLGNPSFVTMVKLRNALDVPWEALFQGPRDAQLLVRPKDRQIFRARESDLKMELLTPGFGGPYRFFKLAFPPGHDSSAVPTRVEGQHSIHVLRGRLAVTVGQETYTLAPGDTLTFPGSVPFSTRTVGRTICEAVTVRAQTT